MAVIRTALLYAAEVDESVGAVVQAILRELVPAAFVVQSSVVSDQRNLVAESLRRRCDEEEVDLLITLGGIAIAPGTSSRESVSLSMEDVVERDLPGLGEAMRAYALEEDPLALLVNAQAGIRGRTLIVNLPSDATLAPLFLEAIADLLEPIVQRLQGEHVEIVSAPIETPPSDDAEPTAASDSHSSRSPLDEEEFAAFLAQRRKESD